MTGSTLARTISGLVKTETRQIKSESREKKVALRRIAEWYVQRQRERERAEYFTRGYLWTEGRGVYYGEKGKGRERGEKSYEQGGEYFVTGDERWRKSGVDV